MDLPSSIFTEEAGRAAGNGQRFRIADGRATRDPGCAQLGEQFTGRQLFNSSERRLAVCCCCFRNLAGRTLISPHFNYTTLAEMIDITRSRVSHFMKKFRELSLISYNGHIEVYSSLLLEAGPGRNWQSATRSIVQEHFSVWDDALPLITRLGLPNDCGPWPIQRLSTGERQRLGLVRTDMARQIVAAALSHDISTCYMRDGTFLKLFQRHAFERGGIFRLIDLDRCRQYTEKFSGDFPFEINTVTF